MTDPDTGARPNDRGALADSAGEGRKSTRRGRRRRRKGGSAPVASTPNPGPGAERPTVASAEKRSESPAADSVKSKGRKRRRRRGGSAPAGAQTQKPQSSQSDGARNHGRSLQGRPLGPRPDEGRAPPSTATEQARDPQPPVTPTSGDRPRPAPTRHQPDPRSRHGSDALYAALDLGTNNCRLLIAQPTRPGNFRVVDAFSRIVRLGEGLGASGRLNDDAMDRSIEALKVCAQKLSSRPVRKMRLIATEACRAADNGAAFLARVEAETGLKLEIINRETEARLAVSGCATLIGPEARAAVLFDIGGGSSEIAVLQIGERRSPRLANHITHWTSLPVGVVTLSERHGGRDVTPDIFEAMTREVEAMLDKFDSPAVDMLAGSAGETGHFHLIGTSGTVTTLAGVHLNLPRYDRRQVDGLWLADDEVSAMQAKLLSLDFTARAANPCIGPDRADLVLAGCAILEAIRRRWPSERMRVADRGLREGLLTDMMADDGAWSRHGHRRPSGFSNGPGKGGRP